jgi:hypothetical protein
MTSKWTGRGAAICIAAVLLHVSSGPSVAAGAALRAAGKVFVTGSVAGVAAANADAANIEQTEAEAKLSHAREQLRKQGADIYQTAVYSLSVNLKRDVSSVYWADIFSKPDVFAVVFIEGQQRFLIPEINNEYSGQPLLMHVLARNAPPGSRIVVHLYDDDSGSDAAWNAILQSRVAYNIGFVLPAFAGVPLRGDVSGSLQLLDKPIILDAPDLIGSLEFFVPDDVGAASWVSKASLVDSANRVVGSITFARVLGPVEQAAMEYRGARWKWIVWTSIALLLALICAKYVIEFWRSPGRG